MGYKNINFDKETVFLVTGGAGFIGSNLVDAILNLGLKVKILDNFSTGKIKNIETALQNSNCELIKGDIRDIDICMKCCKNVDYVLHQAALGSVPRSIEDPMTSSQVNIEGTLNMLWAAKENKVKRFVYASSSAVYGDHPKLPKKEGEEGKLLSPYAITKKVDELYAQNFNDLYNLQTIGLRYFNVFGKRQDPDSIYAAVIPIFVKNLLENKAATIDGDGKQSRDFTYIENVIEANLKSCLAACESCGQAYNIAYGGREYLIDLYIKLSNLLGKEITPNYGPDRVGDIKHSNACIDSAKSNLNYDPNYDLSKGLDLTIEWYKENL